MAVWIPGWGYRETDFSLFPLMTENETQRLWFLNNLESEKARLRFSNRYGRTVLPVERVEIAECDENGVISRSIPVFFDGEPSVSLAPGEIRRSDEISLPARPGTWIAVSLYIREKTRVTCAISSQSRLVTRMACQKGGDFCGAPCVEGERFLDEAREFMLLKPLYKNVAAAITQVEFLCDENVKTVCAFGDSITQHGNWSEALARRLYEACPGRVALFNRGICGNRVLHDASIRSKFGGYFGEGALERFEEDVYDPALKTPDWVLCEEGVNDIIQPYDGTCPQYEGVTAMQIVGGYRQLAAMARARGSGVAGANLMPFRGFNAVWNGITAGIRRQINHELEERPVFDHLMDFSSAVADPADGERLAPEYNCGDNLHPNIAGGRSIAEGIGLNWILNETRP